MAFDAAAPIVESVLPYSLSQIAIAVISPLGTALALLTTGSVLGISASARSSRRLGSLLVFLGLLWLWLWSLPAASTWLQVCAERSFPALPVESLPRADAIIVLGGALSPPSPNGPYPDMSAAADRGWHSARLFHAGKAPLVVASGGSDPRITPVSEARAYLQLLTDLGVPKEAIALEERSRTTHENAEFTALLLKERGIRRILLVTSALHMQRASAEFEDSGLEVIPAATDHTQPKYVGLQTWLPDAAALDASARTFKEIVGRMVVRLRTDSRRS